MLYTNNDDKPLLLVFPYDVMAHYLRCIQLSHYLKPFFKIKFLYSNKYNAFIEEAGFETFQCAALNAERVQKRVEVFDFSWLNERDLYYIFNEQYNVITKLKASAVLSDVAPTLKMAAEKCGTLHISLINGYMSRYYTYVRRIPRSYSLYKFLDILPTKLSDYFTAIGEQISFQSIHRPFNKIRKRSNLPLKHSYLQEIEGDVNLLCDLPLMFPQTNLPENYYFIPPLFHKGRQDYNRVIEKLDANKKTLYVSMGSTGNWEKLLFLNDAVYKKFNIITAGDANRVLSGTNIFAYSFIDSYTLFAQIDLFICHGGNGTTYQALSHGIPVLCATSHIEQDYNVDGLERLQLGRSIENVANEDMPELIEEWVQKKGNRNLSLVRNKIEEMSGKFEQIIENILAKEFALM